MSIRVLIITQDAQQLERIKSALGGAEFLLRFEAQTQKALQCAGSWRPQIALLDLGRAGAPWRECLKPLIDIPVLVFLLYGPERQREMLETLGEGAVSALADPFAAEELLVRVRALVRNLRILLPVDPPLSFGALSLDVEGRRALVGGRAVKLTPKEFDILKLLVESTGRILTRRHILEAVWGYDSTADARNVDSQISKLRKKLGRRVSSAISGVSGQGYCFQPQAIA